MTTGPTKQPTIGILYGGDMGVAVGQCLIQSGARVVTTCEDRSAQTIERVSTSGIEVLDTFEDVAAQSDIVFSVVLPSAAVEIARRYAELKHLHPAGSLFVEANTIGTTTLAEIGRIFSGANVAWVDAGIQGTASRMGRMGVVYLSGPDCPHVQMLTNQQALHIVSLGTDPGLASTMKLLMTGMAKSTAAAFFEIASLAEQLGILDQFLERYEEFYPDLMRVIRRTLPTYAQHASRRIGDVRNLEDCAAAESLQMPLMHEVGNLIGRLASVDWGNQAQVDGEVAPVIRSACALVPEEFTLKGEGA